jgi:hypothetical protein
LEIKKNGFYIDMDSSPMRSLIPVYFIKKGWSSANIGYDARKYERV